MKKQSILTALLIVTVLTAYINTSVYAMGQKTKKTQQPVQEDQVTLPVIDAHVAHTLLMGNKAVFVDALSPETYSVSRIPGAVNISAADPEANMKNLASVKKDDIVVVYCAHAKCGAAKKIADYLVNQGFSQVYYFKGGKKDWQESGYSLEK